MEVVNLNNMNIDENTMKNIKNMVDNGNLSDAISNISPEMIQNFSKILSNQGEKQNANNQNNQVKKEEQNESKTENSTFDFSNLDMNTVMKMSSAINKMKDTKNDPRAKLLMSLKPYLKDSRKQKLDQYVQLLNMSSVFELFKENGGDFNSNSK